MSQTALCTAEQEHVSLQECPYEQSAEQPRISFDALDSLPLRCLPGDLPATTKQILVDATTELTHEGARGSAARRILARDVQLARVQLRQLEALRLITLKTYINDCSGSDRRVRLLERLVNNQHRRLLASLDALVRLDPAPVAVRVTAAQAAVVIDQSRTNNK